MNAKHSHNIHRRIKIAKRKKKCLYNVLKRSCNGLAAHGQREEKVNWMAGEEAEVRLVQCRRMNGSGAEEGEEESRSGGKVEGEEEEGTDLSSSNLVSPCLLGSHHKMDRHRRRTGRWMWAGSQWVEVAQWWRRRGIRKEEEVRKGGQAVAMNIDKCQVEGGVRTRRRREVKDEKDITTTIQHEKWPKNNNNEHWKNKHANTQNHKRNTKSTTSSTTCTVSQS